MSSIFLEFAIQSLQPRKKFNACPVWNRKAPHISNFRHEKAPSSDVPSFPDIFHSQKEKRVSHFSFFKVFKAIITSLTLWATVNQLFHLFHPQHRHCANSYMSDTSARSTSSSLLSSCHNSSISLVSKPFFTRTSSIADDETTLCPSIPNSISFRSLDDLTVGSGPTNNSIHTSETQTHATMSIGPPDSPPINHQTLDNPPPRDDAENETDDSSATGVPNVDTASSVEAEDPEVIAGTPIDHCAAQAAKNASPTTPIDLFQQFEAMMAKMQDNLLAQQQKSIEKIMAETISPKLKQMDDLQATLFPQGTPTKSPTKAPFHEVHFQVSDDSPSNKSFASATNSSTTASNIPVDPPKANPPPPKATPPPVFQPETRRPRSQPDSRCPWEMSMRVSPTSAPYMSKPAPPSKPSKKPKPWPPWLTMAISACTKLALH
jgi:hypothetical protein